MEPQISVVAPVYNEEVLVREFYQRISTVMACIGEPWELVIVDDGSRDQTPEELDRIQADDPDHVIVIHFARNFGHQLAITAGMDYARGAAVVTIDSDLQDPPEVIPELVRRWREGYEVVYAVRAEREGETWFKLATAGLFYRVIQKLTSVTIPMEAGDFRLLDRKALTYLKAMREHDRFVRAMTSWVGFRQTGVPYRRHARKAGTTKYTLGKMLRLAVDAITGFSVIPLKLALWSGVGATGLGVLLALVVLVIRLGGKAPLAGQGLTASLVLFVGGVQLLTVGILGEYIGRIYTEVRQRPLYTVREVRCPEGYRQLP
ncbi:MAG: glycosyltransferase family 2 protein [Anaerolineae bacterium]|jgi:dolichol-phosphate mannosyltransferase|nr:glycosyltransferase family 2 protein [Anaerolineae bacterium]